MKKLTATLLVLAALASSAFAHHPSPSDNAGGNMSSNSGHLNLVF
jgi:Spy/CpxP family protein refolding chaperone